jgi:hypothetical protein
MVPVHVIALALLLRVSLSGRHYDAWLRLVALSAFVQHGTGLFYVNVDRYHLLTWLLTSVAVAAWIRAEGLALLDRWRPGLREKLLGTTPAARLADRIRRVTAWSGVNDAR